MATLYKRGESFYLNWCEDGVQYRRSLGKIERRAAEALRAEKEAELRGLITPTRGVTIGDVIGDYLKWYETARPATFKRARSALKPFRERFDPASAESLAPSVIDKWAHSGPHEKAVKLARAAFKRAIAQRVIGLSPMDGVSTPKPVTSRAPDYYQPHELQKLTKTRHAAIWRFMVSTGIRRGEMAKAVRSDIRNGVLYVESVAGGRTKSGKWRAIPLNRDAKAAARSLGDDRLVECHPDTLGDWFTAEARSVHLRGTLHWLRHTFCTGLVQSGHSLHEVKMLAGHSSITVTEQYAHHAPGFARAAVDSMADWIAQKQHRHAARRRKIA